MKKIIFLSILVLAPTLGLAKGHTVISPLTPLKQMREIRKIRHDIKDIEKLKARTDKTIENLVTFATNKLLEAGHVKLSKDLYVDYTTNYIGYLSVNKALGDHAPLTEYLDILYEALVEYLGEPAVLAFRLDDIKTLNYAIPVTFSPDLAFDKGDYSLHFTPLAKITSYWGTIILCTAVSYGTSLVIPFACSSPALGVERMVGTFVAPVASDFVYCRRVKNGIGC